MANTSQAELELASLAHRLWCDRMAREGWQSGPTYNPEAHVHDALVPFERLSRSDQRSIVLDVIASDLVDDLGNLPSYGRGAAAELVLADVYAGLEVAFDGEPSSRGVVEAWEEDSDWPGCLRTITVRWETGEVTVHQAVGGELCRRP